MGAIPGWLYRQLGKDISIQPHLGTGTFGETHGPAFTVRAIVEDQRKRMREVDGTEVISESIVLVPLNTNAPQGSLVTIGDRTATVLRAAKVDGGRLPVPSHLELYLT